MEKADTIIPFQLRSCLMPFNIRAPTDQELMDMPPITLTDENPWNPKEHDDVDETFYANAMIECEDDISELDDNVEMDSIKTIAVNTVTPSLKD
eukprot:scaffold326867_cov35-Attheya_sp.AAC.1